MKHRCPLTLSSILLLSFVITAPANTPFISEFMAVGNEVLQDEGGDTPDWIEIYNPNETDIDLAGYYLTDDPETLAKWTFPSNPLHAGGYLIVFASGKDRAEAGSQLHTNFKLAGDGEYLALVAPDGVTILSEFVPTFPPQEPAVSYGTDGPLADGPTGYIMHPTPGSANGMSLPTPLLKPKISPGSTTFIDSATVTLTTAFTDGQIYYTANALAYNDRVFRYTGPFTLASNAYVHAWVIDPISGEQSEIAAAAFEKLAAHSNLNGIAPPINFTSDLPIMVVENYDTEDIRGPGSAFVPARLLVFDVNEATGRSALANSPEASFRIGIRRRGQSSSGFAKPQYRVELWNEHNVEINHPLLGLPAESDWVFNGPYTDKSLIRNPMAFALGQAIGLEAPRTQHFELFLSTNGNDLTSSEYVGVYVLMESIKLSNKRTDLQRLDNTDTTEPAISGGYMMRFEPPGIANDGPRATGWSSVEIIEPEIPAIQQRNWLGQYLNDFASTLNWRRGTPNNTGIPDNDPLTGYPAFIDLNSFVNLLVLNELVREQDSYVRSDYMFKDRLGKLHKGPLWDYNLITDTGCCFDNRNTSGWQYQHDYNRGGRDHSYEPDWFVPLLRCPDFKQAYIDRWFQLRHEGILETTQLFALIDSLADPLLESAQRNFIKWDNLHDSRVGFPTPVSNTWYEQIDIIKAWLTERMDWIDRQFPSQVTFPQGSGVVKAGTDIALNSSAGFIFYTTDGSDPRLTGGTINPAAQILGDNQVSNSLPHTFVSQVADNVQALRPHTALPGPTAWTAPLFDATTWQTGHNGIGYENSPADYSGLININVGNVLQSQPHSVYVRYPFQITDAPNYNVLTLRVKYDDGFIAYLNGACIAARNAPSGTPAWNNSATGDHSDSEAVTFTDIDISDFANLLQTGYNVLAVHILNNGGSPNATNTGCTSSDMLMIAELIGSNIISSSGTISIETTTALTARNYDAGQWGPLSTVTYVVGTPAQADNLIVTELNYHPSDPTNHETAIDPTFSDDDFEFIELRNISNTQIDLTGIAFVRGIEFTMTLPTVLYPNERIILVKNLDAFTQRYGQDLSIAGVYTKKLSNDGESLQLIDLFGNDIFQFIFNDTWFPMADGDGYTLVLQHQDIVPVDYNDPDVWSVSNQLLGNPGE